MMRICIFTLTRLWKLPKSTSKKQNIYNILLINMTLSCQIKQIYISLASCVYWINEQCVPKFTFVLVLNWTAFNCNIDRDWMIYPKHPIRSLLTSMLRNRTLFPSNSIKGSNYGEFLKDKNVLLRTRLYKYAPFGNTLFIENEQEHE
jgi:hypothetical protein